MAAMDLSKSWLYKQGMWALVDNPVYELLDDDENPLTALHYDEKAAEVHGLEPHYVVRIYGRDVMHEELPPYPYYVEVDIQHGTEMFYIADFPSYLQIVPRLLELVQKGLQLTQLVMRIKSGEE